MATAQTSRAWVDVGPTNVRYADSIDINAFTISPGFHAAGRRGYAFASGTIAQMSGASTQSGTIGGGISTALGRRLSAEIGGTAGGSAHSDDTRTGQLLGSARLYLNATSTGAWLGGGAGSTWDGNRWRDLLQAGGGGWAHVGWTTGILSLTRTVVDDTVRYADAVLTLRREISRLELAGTLGARFGDPVPSLVTDRAWGSLSAVLWMRPNLGAVVAAGTYPIDFSQGYPGGRFASLGLRIAARRERVLDVPPPSNGEHETGARAFEVRSAGAGPHRLRVHAPGASSVEVIGTFTDWRPLRLTRERAGWWSVTVSLGRRSHEINLRVNGGAWTVPPGLTSIRDEFGGAVGLLVP